MIPAWRLLLEAQGGHLKRGYESQQDPSSMGNAKGWRCDVEIHVIGVVNVEGVIRLSYTSSPEPKVGS